MRDWSVQYMQNIWYESSPSMVFQYGHEHFFRGKFLSLICRFTLWVKLVRASHLTSVVYDELGDACEHYG